MSNTNSQIDSSSFTEEDRIFIYDYIDMFSAIKGKPLKIFFTPNSKRHYITYENNEYHIYTDPNHKDIPFKTAIEHEVSHLLFDTKFYSFKKHADKILENTPKEFYNLGYKSIHSIYNIFEDMRIESWFGKYKQGFRRRIIETRKSLGRNSQITKEEIPKNPIQALLNSRFFRNDLVRRSNLKICEQYINESEFLSPKGSIILVKKFYDNVFLPYLLKQKQKQNELENELNKLNKSTGDLNSEDKDSEEEEDNNWKSVV